jgi:DNA (cytosine-5)-methyltransferase 1
MQLSAFGDLHKPASVVLFAGLGGSCEGIRRATGVSPIAAINHDAHAIELHERNHRETKHFREDVFEVSPSDGSRGRKLDLLWLSPDCTHHSRAKGSAPRDSGRRSLADAVFPWLTSESRPKVVMLENVPEWLNWGPVDVNGQPVPSGKGEYFRSWVARVQSYGYSVEWRILTACDYGAPTSRRRVYLIARRDNRPIVWPEPTRGPGRANPWRTAAECIDWSVPMLSIFATAEEAKTWAREHNCHAPKRPLEANTLKRVAAGVKRYVVDNSKPYIVPQSYDAAWIAKHYGGVVGHGVDRPLGAITTVDHHSLVTVNLVHHRGQSVGREADAPAPTVTSTGMGHLGIVSATLINTRNGEREGQAPRIHDICKPYPTITASGSQGGLVEAELTSYPTESFGRAKQVSAFLVSYYGTGEALSLTDPLDTVTTRDRFGLVAVRIEGEPYVITDISMRMLQPRELARAMGFPDSYILTGTKNQQVARIGNAVCPDVAEALVRANL